MRRELSELSDYQSFDWRFMEVVIIVENISHEIQMSLLQERRR